MSVLTRAVPHVIRWYRTAAVRLRLPGWVLEGATLFLAMAAVFALCILFDALLNDGQ